MTRKEFSNIRNLRQLEIARLEIAGGLSRRKNDIRKDVNHLQRLFRPNSLFNTGWQLMAPSSPSLNSILLSAVRRLKARLRKD